MARIKGTAVRGVLKYAKEHGYPGGTRGLVEALPERARSDLERPVLASSWYPYETYGLLLAQLGTQLGGGRAEIYRDVGRFAGDLDLRGVFRIVAVFASVERFLQMSSFVWSRYCDEGRFYTRDVAPGRGVGVLEFPGVHPAHCVLLAGWIEAMGLGAGAKTARMTKARCVHRGDPCCEYHGRWTT